MRLTISISAFILSFTSFCHVYAQIPNSETIEPAKTEKQLTELEKTLKGMGVLEVVQAKLRSNFKKEIDERFKFNSAAVNRSFYKNNNSEFPGDTGNCTIQQYEQELQDLAFVVLPQHVPFFVDDACGTNTFSIGNDLLLGSGFLDGNIVICNFPSNLVACVETE